MNPNRFIGASPLAAAASQLHNSGGCATDLCSPCAPQSETQAALSQLHEEIACVERQSYRLASATTPVTDPSFCVDIPQGQAAQSTPPSTAPLTNEIHAMITALRLTNDRLERLANAIRL